MKYLYKGNLNSEANKYVSGQIEYYYRGSRSFQEKSYDLLAIKTRFIEKNNDLCQLIREYVLPMYGEGDILVISSKVVSMCQGNVVARDELSIGLLARVVDLLTKENVLGSGIRNAPKFQLAVNMCGYPRILYACAAAVLGKLRGQKGKFYEVLGELGEEVAGIDGFYEKSAFPYYREHGVMLPVESEKVCRQLEASTGIPCVVSDTNDRAVHICGRSEGAGKQRTEFYEAVLYDNPAGQDDETTPFVLISQSGKHELREYVPPPAISEEEYKQWIQHHIL